MICSCPIVLQSHTVTEVINKNAMIRLYIAIYTYLLSPINEADVIQINLSDILFPKKWLQFLLLDLKPMWYIENESDAGTGDLNSTKDSLNMTLISKLILVVFYILKGLFFPIMAHDGSNFVASGSADITLPNFNILAKSNFGPKLF